VTLNSKEENSEEFFLYFVQELASAGYRCEKLMASAIPEHLGAHREGCDSQEERHQFFRLLLDIFFYYCANPKENPVSRHTQETANLFYSAGTDFSVEVGMIQCPQKQLFF
jgi:hypothetical protein